MPKQVTAPATADGFAVTKSEGLRSETLACAPLSKLVTPTAGTWGQQPEDTLVS